MKISLKIQIPLIVTLVLCAAVATSSIFFLGNMRQVLADARDERGMLLLKCFVTTIEESVLSDNMPKLHTFCHSIVNREKDVKFALVIDTGGIITGHNNFSMVGRSCDSPLCVSILQSSKVMITPFEHENDSLYDYSTPLFIAGTRIGSARIVLSNSFADTAQRRILYAIGMVSAAFLCIGILLSLLITHLLITRHVAKLRESAEITGSGNFNYRMGVTAKNELGSLMETFNAMNESLFAQKKQMLSLFNTVQTLEVKKERASLISQALKIVGDIIGPQQCILGLFDENSLVVNATAGFDPKQSLAGRLILLPNEIFGKLFHKPVARKFLVDALEDTLNDLGIAPGSLSDEILLSPMIHGNRAKGVFMLIGKKNGREFEESDMKYMDIIALSTAMSLANIALLEKSETHEAPQTAMSEYVKKFLLPQAPLKTKEIEVCSFFRPAGNTHGNWHGFIEDRESRRLSVFIADAAGEGVPAVLAAATAHGFIQTMSILRKRYERLSKIIYKPQTPDLQEQDSKEMPITISPSYLLSLLNTILFQNSLGKQSMTLFAATIDLAANKVHFANAGHETPVFMRKKGNLPQALSASGPSLGDTENPLYHQETLDIESGDAIIWYTEGVFRCIDPSKQTYDNTRFMRRISESFSLSAKDICKNLADDINAFRNNTPPPDDITLVIAKIL